MDFALCNCASELIYLLITDILLVTVSPMDNTLPALPEIPIHHPDCCLSLSTTLLTYLASLCTEVSSSTHGGPTTVLSIGSGTGLLEVLLSQHLGTTCDRNLKTIEVEGVEVYASPPINRYLPSDAVHVVHGTWDICQRVRGRSVKVWMLVYPRKVELVEAYVDKFSGGEEEGLGVEMIVWAGPRSDTADYENLFSGLAKMGWRIEVDMGEEAGVKEWETVVVLRRRRAPESR